MEIFAAFLLMMCMTQVSLPSWAATHQGKEVSLFPGLREGGGTTVCTAQIAQITEGLTVWTLTLYGHKPRNLSRTRKENTHKIPGITRTLKIKGPTNVLIHIDSMENQKEKCFLHSLLLIEDIYLPIYNQKVRKGIKKDTGLQVNLKKGH